MPPIPEISSIYEILNILEQQVSKGTVLINNTHIISNLEKEHPEMKSVNVCKILNNCIEEIKAIYNKRKIYITKLYKDQIINVKGNNLLKNVFNNILINAIQHNDNSIIIKVKCFIPDGEDICRLEFIDNGRGIPKHKKEKIFEENFKLQKNGKGLGIGLYLVNRIINLYNGKIWVEDRIEGNPSMGSKFIIELPLA